MEWGPAAGLPQREEKFQRRFEALDSPTDEGMSMAAKEVPMTACCDRGVARHKAGTFVTKIRTWDLNSGL